MDIDNNTDGLSLEELRVLVPEIQQISDKFKRTEDIQSALFDISELASSVMSCPASILPFMKLSAA